MAVFIQLFDSPLISEIVNRQIQEPDALVSPTVKSGIMENRRCSEIMLQSVETLEKTYQLPCFWPLSYMNREKTDMNKCPSCG